MNTLKVLKDARAKIENPEHWCQGHYAVTTAGKGVGPAHPRACAWCAQGALEASGFTPYSSDAIGLAQLAAEELGFASIPELNDTTDHATVLTMLDRAIERARRDGEG